MKSWVLASLGPQPIGAKVIILVVFLKHIFYNLSYPVLKISITTFSIVAKISSIVRICKLFSVVDEFAGEVLTVTKKY